MEILINDKRKIKEIQSEFNSMFPYLKIEFFSKPPGKAGTNPKSDMILQNRTIGDCRKVHKAGHLTILPELKVSEMEDAFRKNYGLIIQVFRKSGKVWLETSVTDHWTLLEQNLEGEELSM